MIPRRQSREWALQFLTQVDLNPAFRLDDDLERFWQQLKELELERSEEDDRLVKVLNFDSQDKPRAEAFAAAKEFTEERVRGVMESRTGLDANLGKRLVNWPLYRLGTVERNVLRLGFWELENCPDIPPPIVINEYVDLAKFFSETKSGRFVNGVLDKYARELKAEAAAPEVETYTP